MKRQQNVTPTSGNMSESNQICKICGGTLGHGLKNCPGCSPQAVAGKRNTDSAAATPRTTESPFEELYKASTKVEELSKTVFSISILLGILVVVVGIGTYVVLAPTDSDEGATAVGLLAGFTLGGAFAVSAVMMALIAQYTRMRAIEVRANN